MKTQELYEKVLSYFAEAIPVAETELDYDNPFQLLIAVILSAQCTDKRVNMVTPDLFARYDTPEELAAAHPEEVYNYIKSISYPNNKAKHLVGMAQKLVSEFDGKVPDTLEELVKLPGVGRKIANLMLGDVFGQPNIVTDTHCIRICGRLGFYPESEKNAPKIEKILDKCIDKPLQSDFCHRIVYFGRDICTARSPKCGECPMKSFCKAQKQLHLSKN